MPTWALGTRKWARYYGPIGSIHYSVIVATLPKKGQGHRFSACSQDLKRFDNAPLSDADDVQWTLCRPIGVSV